MWLCEGKLKVKTAHFRLPFKLPIVSVITLPLVEKLIDQNLTRLIYLGLNENNQHLFCSQYFFRQKNIGIAVSLLTIYT